MALKILLADDSLTAQNMGKKILTEAGYEVIAVSNGAQAMKKIASENPDLVVLDVYMPGYSGLEVCERMRGTRETATTPVVLSVGKMEAFQPEESNRVHADGLIVKPFEATELLAMVKKLAENISPAPRAKRRPEPKPVPEPQPTPEPTLEALDSAAPSPADHAFEIERQFVNVPQEVASAPAIGMDLIPEEALHPEVWETSAVEEPPDAIEFEVEQAPQRIEVDPGPRLSSADGLSGVFELEPSAPPVVETPAAPARVDGFETFSSPEPPAQFEGVHDLVAAPPEDYGRDPQPEVTAAPAMERFSDSPAAEPPSVESEHEPFGKPQLEATSGSGTAQPAQVLPELTSWQDPPSAETAHVPGDSIANTSEAELAPAAAVWIAEEAQIESHEFATPLHQQMEMQAHQVQGSAEGATEEPVSVSMLAATEEDCTSDRSEELLTPAVMVTEAPVDPARIASIVNQVLERLKPELVAAVTRELEKNNGQ